MEELPYLKTIVKGAGLVLIGTIISKLLSFVYRIFIARYFGVEEYGIFSMALALLSFFMIIVLLGLPQGITRYVSYYKSKNSPSKVKGTILDSFKLSLIVSVIIAFLLFLISDTIVFYLFHDTTGKITTLIRIMSLSLPFFSLFMLSTSASVGFKKIEHRIYTEYISQNLLKLVFTVFFGLIGLGVFGIGLAWTLAIILTSFLSLYLLNKTFPLIKKTIKSHPMKKELLHFSLPLLFTGFLGVIISYTDTVMLGFFTTPKEVGIYNAALPIAQLLMIPATLLTSLLLPVFSEVYVKKGITSVKKIFDIVSKWSFYLTFPVFIIIVFYPSFILRFVFGQEFIIGNLALILLSLGFFLTFLSLPMYNLLMLLKKTKLLFYFSLIQTIINFILNLVLIPLFNINGAAAALLVSYFTGFSLTWIELYRKTKITGISRDFIKCIFLVYILLSISIILKKIVQNIVIIGILYFILYFIFAIKFLFVKERQTIIKLLKNKVRV